MKYKLMGAAGALLAAACGYAAGYFYATRKVIPALEEQLEEVKESFDAELAKTQAYYKRLYKAEEFSDPEAMLQRRTPKTPEGFEHETPEEVEAKAYPNSGALKEFQENYRPNVPFPVGEPKKPKKVQKTYGNELPEDPGIGPKGVYIISEAEFMEGELGYEQVSVTWYDGDQVLADTDDSMIEDPIDLVGPRALKSFGKKSGNPNIVYVRNEIKCIDYEVAYTDMKYSEAVHGIIDEE